MLWWICFLFLLSHLKMGGFLLVVCGGVGWWAVVPMGGEGGGGDSHAQNMHEHACAAGPSL